MYSRENHVSWRFILANIWSLKCRNTVIIYMGDVEKLLCQLNPSPCTGAMVSHPDRQVDSMTPALSPGQCDVFFHIRYVLPPGELLIKLIWEFGDIEFFHSFGQLGPMT